MIERESVVAPRFTEFNDALEKRYRSSTVIV